MTITAVEVRAAAKRIGPHIRNTPIVSLEAEVLGVPALAKLDVLQHTGAFKARGALNRVLAAAERGELQRVGVIAASGGNHGLAVAYAARKVNVPAEIFVPETTPEVKLGRLAAYGATVRLVGTEYADALVACEKRQLETNALMVPAFDDPLVVAGQGTAALEIAAAVDIDTLLVAVGGGGLVAGSHLALGESRRVVAVEPVGIPTLAQAASAGAPVPVAVSGVAADALGARQLGGAPWEVLVPALKSGAVRSVLVTDDDIRAAQRTFWQELRLVVEPGGATAAAALLSGAYQPAVGERVAVLVCGANTDPASVV